MHTVWLHSGVSARMPSQFSRARKLGTAILAMEIIRMVLYKVYSIRATFRKLNATFRAWEHFLGDPVDTTHVIAFHRFRQESLGAKLAGVRPAFLRRYHVLLLEMRSLEGRVAPTSDTTLMLADVFGEAVRGEVGFAASLASELGVVRRVVPTELAQAGQLGGAEVAAPFLRAELEHLQAGWYA